VWSRVAVSISEPGGAARGGAGLQTTSLIVNPSGDVVTRERRKQVREEHLEGEAREVRVLAVSAGAEGNGSVHITKPMSKRRRADAAERVADEGHESTLEQLAIRAMLDDFVSGAGLEGSLG
jgi:hypothetical protein